ncbi:HEAT repeat domain-containing protein [Aquimarina sp. M1]
MKHTFKLTRTSLLILLLLLVVMSCERDHPTVSGSETEELLEKAQEHSSVLSFDESSIVSIGEIVSGLPYGNLVNEHINLSMGFGKDAEEKYQRSLYMLRRQPKISASLFEIYHKVPAENYLYRTMVVEALKELNTDTSLQYLYKIAMTRIPRDTQPENEEIDTRTDEIIIRLTAVEGIGILAINKNEEAEKALIQLIDHEDLSVRQMAVRSYLLSPFGNIQEKKKELYEKLPREEYWYITEETTNIRKVEHPDMPETFDLKENDSKETPKIR